MSLYALISPRENRELDAAVRKEFDGRFFKIADGQFAVSTDISTTQQVAERLDIGSGKLGQVIVLPIFNYFGWHNRDLWEWLAAEAKRSSR